MCKTTFKQQVIPQVVGWKTTSIQALMVHLVLAAITLIPIKSEVAEPICSVVCIRVPPVNE